MPLKITARQTQPLDLNADVVVMGTWTFPKAKAEKKKKKDDDGKAGTGVAFVDALDRALGGGVSRLIAKEEFTGKKDQTLSVPTLGRLPAAKLVLLGLGDRDKAGPAEVRSFAAKAARIGNAEKAKTLVLAIPDGLEGRLRTVAEGLELGTYRFTKYLTGDRKPKESLEEATIAGERRFPPDAKRAIALGQGIAAGVNVSRDLSNEPPNVMFPMALAKAAQDAAKEHKFKVTIFDDKEIVKRGMQLLHAVGRGSSHPPVLVHMSYVPTQKTGKKSRKKYVFVGKGITFDTGGISIKPAQSMGEMKHDMSGAANMVGLMIAVAALKPNVEVHAIMSCAENMPDGNSYRPGDVWGSLDGKSVEIINTDAEGRLVLADALAYAAKELEPDLLVDNATLTGACVVALGTTYSAFYATNADTAQRFAAGVKSSGEQMWHMPLIEELREQLKSEVADLKHTGERYGGSITAALFLREFIGKTKNWVHADIAGPAQTDRPYAWHGKGATGHGVLTFLSLVERAGK
ncbi:MAG TPA: leucyl aminopeptidase [Polyangiaceae bacterium]